MTALTIFSPVSADTLSGKIAEKLTEAIERGELPLGSRIQEASLARQMGISRGPLREALRLLEGRKLVTRTPNFGARVCALSDGDIIEMFQIRESLEGTACRLATERMTPEVLAELDELLLLHEKQIGEGTSYYQTSGDLDFHFRIARASGNARLEHLLCEELYYFIRIHRYRSSAMPGRAHKALSDHRAIVKAMREGKGEKAETLMRAHIRTATENLISNFARNG